MVEAFIRNKRGIDVKRLVALLLLLLTIIGLITYGNKNKVQDFKEYDTSYLYFEEGKKSKIFVFDTMEDLNKAKEKCKDIFTFIDITEEIFKDNTLICIHTNILDSDNSYYHYEFDKIRDNKINIKRIDNINDALGTHSYKKANLIVLTVSDKLMKKYNNDIDICIIDYTRSMFGAATGNDRVEKTGKKLTLNTKTDTVNIEDIIINNRVITRESIVEQIKSSNKEIELESINLIDSYKYNDVSYSDVYIVSVTINEEKHQYFIEKMTGNLIHEYIGWLMIF